MYKFRRKRGPEFTTCRNMGLFCGEIKIFLIYLQNICTQKPQRFQAYAPIV